MAASTKFVRRVFDDFRKRGGHDATCMPQLEILSAKPGYVRASLKIEPQNLNRIGSLHGGLICTLVDTMGSLTLSSKGMWLTGVSTDISTTFIRAAGGTGDTIICEGLLESAGKTLAYTSTRLTDQQGRLLARGSHTKFIGHALKDPDGLNVQFDEAGEHEVAKNR